MDRAEEKEHGLIGTKGSTVYSIVYGASFSDAEQFLRQWELKMRLS